MQLEIAEGAQNNLFCSCYVFKTDLSVLQEIDERGDEQEAVEKRNMTKKGAEKTGKVLILWCACMLLKYYVKLLAGNVVAVKAVSKPLQLEGELAPPAGHFYVLYLFHLSYYCSYCIS